MAGPRRQDANDANDDTNDSFRIELPRADKAFAFVLREESLRAHGAIRVSIRVIRNQLSVAPAYRWRAPATSEAHDTARATRNVPVQVMPGARSNARNTRTIEHRVNAPHGAERFDPAQMLDRRVSFLTEQLQLSSSQQTQVRSMLSDEMNAMRALRPQGTREGRGQGGVGRDSTRSRDDARRGERAPGVDARRDSVRAQMQQIRQRTEQRLASVLNAQQQTKYRELQKQMEDRRGA